MYHAKDGAPVILLGATGKLGRMVRALWPDTVPLCALGRRAAPGVTVWHPGAPVDALPRAGAVIALWGVTPGPGADLADNARLGVAAMELGAALGADRVLHCSSGAVYAPGPDPLTEETPPDPRSAYGAAKVEMERRVAARAVEPARDPRPVSLRIGNVAGAESLFAALSGPGPVTLDRFEDGTGPRRSYIAPGDLVRVLLALLEVPRADLPECLNVAAPQPTGMAEIAQAAGCTPRWRAAPAGAVPLVHLDTRRMQAFCPLGTEAAAPAHLVDGWRRALAAQAAA